MINQLLSSLRILQCVLAPKDLHKILVIPSDLELKPGNFGILQGCQCQGGEGCSGAAPAQCQGEAKCPLVSHGALHQKWARFCAAHIKMKESTGEKQLLRGLKATGFLFLLGRAQSQHLALYRSLLISRILHWEQLSLPSTSRRALHPTASFIHARVALGAMGWHPHGHHPLLGRVAAAMAASPWGCCFIWWVLVEDSSSPAFSASCFDGGSEAGQC